MVCAVTCAEKLEFGEELLVGMQTGSCRQKLEYSMHLCIIGIMLMVYSLYAPSLPLLPFSIWAAILFASVLALRLLLLHFVPYIYPQAIST